MTTQEWVLIECPTCGEKSRAEVLASAYRGGWCIGPSAGSGRSGSHKPVTYVVVDRRTHA